MSGKQTQPPVAALLQRLHREGWLGWTHLRIWMQLRDYFQREGNVGGTAPTFFTATAAAHLDAAILHACRLVDDHKDAASVAYLLNVAEAVPKLFRFVPREKISKAVKRDRDKLERLRKLAAGLRVRRDKLLAHLDRQTIKEPEAVQKLCEFKIKDLELLFESLGEMVNRYEGFWSDGEVLWELIGWEDFRVLTLLAEEGVAARRARRRALRNRPSTETAPADRGDSLG